MRDAANLAYLPDLEERYGAASHNGDERRLRIVTSVEKTEGWNVPITGGVSRPALEQAIEELTTFGELEGRLAVDDVLRDARVRPVAPAAGAARVVLYGTRQLASRWGGGARREV